MNNFILQFDDIAYYNQVIKRSKLSAFLDFFKCKRNPSKFINIKDRLAKVRKELSYIDKDKYEYLKSEGVKNW